MVTRYIGIDFGTSSSVVKIYNSGGGDDTVHTLSVGSGIQEIPTVVFKRKIDGAVFVGDEAQAQISQEVDGDIFKNFKLKLISSDENEKNDAIHYTTLFFTYLHDRYVELCNIGSFGKCDVTKVYVSFPAKWPSFVRQTMRECAINSGFGTDENVIGLDEPTAAAVASLHEREKELKNNNLFFENTKYKAMMVDMGAGTTDIVLFEYTIKDGGLHIDNPVTYPTADSVRLCGGREIDDVFSEFCTNYCKSIPANGVVPAGFLKKCATETKTWKETAVSSALRENANIQQPAFITSLINTMTGFGVPMNPDLKPFEMNREIFESITNKHWQNWRKMIAEAFVEAKASGYNSPDDIDVIILNGGHSQWYGVRDFFLGKPFAGLEPITFSKIIGCPDALIQSIRPSQTVAAGLCLKDKAFVAATPLANAFWIQFEYEGKKSQIFEIAQKGHVLPFSSKIKEISDTIKGNFLYKKEFDIKCVVYEGSDINSAVRYEKKVKSPDDGFFAVLFKGILMAVIGTPITLIRVAIDFVKGSLDWNEYSDILESDYKILLGAKIEISEDGIAKILPEITVDDNYVCMDPFKI